MIIPKDELIKIASDVLKCEITMDSDMNNTDTWDSLAHLELIMAVEEWFNTNFDTKKISTLTSMEAILDELEA